MTPRASMVKDQFIFGSYREDFFKIFFATLIVFLLSFEAHFLSSTIVVLATVFLLDGGHVYSTLLEVYADPEELRKSYVWVVTIGSFFLNFLILYFFSNLFFYYIFYFTVFHNMRQGLGITFLYKRGERQGMLFYKGSYYFLTVVPFFLFHLRGRDSLVHLSDAIIRSVDLANYYPVSALLQAYHYGLIFYSLGVLFILGRIIVTKNWNGFVSMVFFFLVYAFAFLISKNEFQSYIILIVSHAIPYFFLMEKRLIRTHSLTTIKKYAVLFLILMFAGGGILDYFQDSIIDLFSDIDILIRALLFTPLIDHFIFDAILWKRGNARFQAFLAD